MGDGRTFGGVGDGAQWSMMADHASAGTLYAAEHFAAVRDHLRPGGLFFLGTAEGRVPCKTALTPLVPGAYRKAAA